MSIIPTLPETYETGVKLARKLILNQERRENDQPRDEYRPHSTFEDEPKRRSIGASRKRTK
jgi:hypothetical protein